MTKRKPPAEEKATSTAVRRVPKAVAAPRTAARSASASSSSSVPEASGLPQRFSFKARGASIEVLDNETGRRVPFPKSETGIVAKVLHGLFSEKSEAKPTPRREKADALPAAHANEEMGLVMRRTTVAVDPSHPNVVLGSPRRHPKGYVVNAYEILVDEEPVGHLIAHPNGRFTLAKGVGLLVEAHSHHTSFENGVLRVENVVPAYRARKAAKASGDQPTALIA